jgi:hypothetical protein
MVGRVKREYLILVEKKIHTPTKPLHLHLFDASLNYYNYIECNKSKQNELKDTIELICIELLSNGVFKCKQSTDPLGEARSWILEKYFFFLEHLKEIHDEHSEKIPIDTNSLVFQKNERISDEEINSWDTLYD